MDVCCLKPLTFAQPYLFRTHHQLPAVGNIMKCPRQSQVMKSCYEEAVISVTASNTDWHKPLSILNENIEKFGLSKYIRHISNHDKWEEISSLLRSTKPIPEETIPLMYAPFKELKKDSAPLE